MTSSTAIFIDTCNRHPMPVCTVAVSEVPGRGLVLRFGAEVGDLTQLVGQAIEMPVILTTRGYSARSSAGFVSVLHQGRPTQSVIGIQGMPFQKGSKSLRLLGKPMEVVVLESAQIADIVTHAGGAGHGWNSNSAAASAADTAVALIARLNPWGVIVTEGQSDYTRGVKFTPIPVRGEDGCECFPPAPEWPEEFRMDRFTDEAICEKALRRLCLVTDNEGEVAVDEQMLVCKTAIMAAIVRSGNKVGHGPTSAKALTGMDAGAYWPAVEASVESLWQARLSEGWTVDVQRQDPSRSRLVVEDCEGKGRGFDFCLTSWQSTEGEIPRVLVEDNILNLPSMNDEEIEDFRRLRRADLLAEKIRQTPMTGVGFRLMPVDSYDFKSYEEFSLKPKDGLEAVEGDSLTAIMANPRLAEVAGGANILFFAVYGEDGACTQARMFGWDTEPRFRWGWQEVEGFGSGLLKAMTAMGVPSAKMTAQDEPIATE